MNLNSLNTITLFSIFSLCWCLIALAVQVYLSKKRRSGSYRYQEYSIKNDSAKYDSAFKAIIYNFTKAMSPFYKESAKLYPVKFFIGLVMHLGIFCSFIYFFLLIIISPSILILPLQLLHFFGFFFLLTSMAAVVLLINRVTNIELKEISNFDDYFSITMMICFLASISLNLFGVVSNNVVLAITSFVFLYVPFGKLRHVVFFFLVRVDFAKKMGHRGVYPL
ncbi:MAG: hypothetical protein HQK49_06540 [Oligoflexia bacterium]|nr:hypothetical protein [Oligoflexia bacterium]